MEDFKIDLTMDAGIHARTITVPVKPFTLIGATTRIGLLTGPMRSRFGIISHIEFSCAVPKRVKLDSEFVQQGQIQVRHWRVFWILDVTATLDTGNFASHQ